MHTERPRHEPGPFVHLESGTGGPESICG
jgi:hypothetical protein